MAPPYRKSCSNCVKSKRRCEHTSGNCERCTAKHLVCSLNRPDVRKDVSNPTSESSNSVGISEDFLAYTKDNLQLFEGDLWSGNGEATAFIEPSWLATLTPGPDLDIQWPSQNGEQEELQIDPSNQFDDIINAAQFTGGGYSPSNSLSGRYYRIETLPPPQIPPFPFTQPRFVLFSSKILLEIAILTLKSSTRTHRNYDRRNLLRKSPLRISPISSSSGDVFEERPDAVHSSTS